MRLALEDSRFLDGRLMHIRIEDFVAEPEWQLRKLLSFLGLDSEEGLLPSIDDVMPVGGVSKEKWYPMSSDLNGRYLDALSTRDVELVDKVCGAEARDLGYALPRIGQ
jgi:hypothetical protein